MPLPTSFPLNAFFLNAYTPSVGTTPVAAYMRVPERARLLNFFGILGGAITTADGTITVAVNGTTVTVKTGADAARHLQQAQESLKKIRAQQERRKQKQHA
jgi:hypothetical protein